MKHTREKHLIGWTEYVDFPDWHIRAMKAKVDTGARTSALHVEDLEELPGGRIRFHVILDRRKSHKRAEVVAPVLKVARVRSSSGHFTERYFVRTRIRIGHVEKEIDISLVSRGKMIFRMLLGRKALEHDFLVDVSARHALGRKPAKKKQKKKTAKKKKDRP